MATDIVDLFSKGLFGQALQVLETSRRHTLLHGDAEVLRVELLETLGRYEDAQVGAQTILGAKGRTSKQRAACEYALGRIAFDQGHTEDAILRFQRAATLADGNDDERLCWCRIRLLNILAEKSPYAATATLLSEVRSLALRTGNPQILAAVHLCAGEADAKRGVLRNAQRHIQLAKQFLTRRSNLWLEAIAENTLLAIALMSSDYEEALVHGDAALKFATESGAAATVRACLGNLGNLHFAIGAFDDAIRFFERAIAALPSSGAGVNANLDSIAQIRLLQGQTNECAQVLSRIARSIQAPSDWLLYANRYSQFTKAQLALTDKHFVQALDQINVVERLAADTDDAILATNSALIKAEILLKLERTDDLLRQLESTVVLKHLLQPEAFARYEQLVARVLATKGHPGAHSHFDRAKRIYDGIGSSRGLIDLERVTAAAQHEQANGISIGQGEIDNSRQATQAIAAALCHAGRPQLQGLEIVELIKTLRCTEQVELIIRDGTATEAKEPRVGPGECETGLRCIQINDVGEPLFDVLIKPKRDTESIIALNAVVSIVEALRHLETARRSETERTALWPLESPPDGVEGAVLCGQMRDLAGLVAKIAPTDVTVLITGESGTGKEILARALHRYSSRSAKALVPFNCASIPRDMLESQLFGHRRGAFTGAERDHIGVIRAAEGGTLFLDEIGEMDLELQPKLLRFLESGEIAPLGQPNPVMVDVRVIAATNAKLDTLVRSGRFREDLFYRLNVFRVAVPPLRERRDEIPSLVKTFIDRAAREFNKGNVQIAPDLLAQLIIYDWPGNIRQLLNEVRRMVALVQTNGLLCLRDLSRDIIEVANPQEHHDKKPRLPLSLSAALATVESDLIKTALQHSDGKVDVAAKALGISRKGLYLKRRRLGI